MIGLAILMAATPSPQGRLADRAEAIELLRLALDAQGGERALRAIRTVTLRSIIVANALEQSVRPEGPYFENYEDRRETRRFEQPALRIDSRSRGYYGAWYAGACWTPRTSLVVDGTALAMRGGRLGPDTQAAVAPAEESLALGPERVLLTALAAGDLRIGTSASLHGYPHDVLRFTWRGVPVRLFLQPTSHMPVAVETINDRPMDIFWSVWGDVTTRVEWDAWTREADGIRYPRRWTETANGQPLRSAMIDEVSLNPAGVGEALTAPAAVENKARAVARPIATLRFDPSGRVEVAPGVTLYPGPWNVVVVDQPEGSYVIEAPLSNAYSAGVVAELRRQGRRMAGLVSTSDSWPHVAGLREYVAEGVPIHALDLNVPLIRRLAASPHVRSPDLLAQRPRTPRLHAVSGRTVIGTGDARMWLIPLRTVTGERQMLVYWPAYRLLYTSDILSLSGDAVWLPQYRDEVASVIAREGIAVTTAFGMHYPPTPWSKISSAQAPRSSSQNCRNDPDG